MKLTWRQSQPVWWSFFWRAVLIGIGFGFIAGFLAGVLAALMGQPQNGALYGAIAGWFTSIPASMIAIKLALQKHSASLAEAFRAGVA